VKIPVKRRARTIFATTDAATCCSAPTGVDEAAVHQLFFQADWRANQAMKPRSRRFATTCAHGGLEDPLSIEDTADKYVRQSLRRVFVDLCRKSVGDYIDRWGFKSDLLRAMYAVTDGFSGCWNWTRPHGHELSHPQPVPPPGSDGTWMICGRHGHGDDALCRGGARATARSSSATRAGEAAGGERRHARRGAGRPGVRSGERGVVSNADPLPMKQLAEFPEDYNGASTATLRPGSTFKGTGAEGAAEFTLLAVRSRAVRGRHH